MLKEWERVAMSTKKQSWPQALLETWIRSAVPVDGMYWTEAQRETPAFYGQTPRAPVEAANCKAPWAKPARGAA
jgi:hypothetical protein